MTQHTVPEIVDRLRRDMAAAIDATSDEDVSIPAATELPGEDTYMIGVLISAVLESRRPGLPTDQTVTGTQHLDSLGKDDLRKFAGIAVEFVGSMLDQVEEAAA